jgi:hypothetical protein
LERGHNAYIYYNSYNTIDTTDQKGLWDKVIKMFGLEEIKRMNNEAVAKALAIAEDNKAESELAQREAEADLKEWEAETQCARLEAEASRWATLQYEDGNCRNGLGGN